MKKNNPFRFRRQYVYLAVALLILLPLLKWGYIQTLDMPWGPRPYHTEPGQNFWLLFKILQVTGTIIGQVLTQKLLLLGIFVMAGTGAHSLSKAGYMAGLIYMFNPYVYARLMTGQWLVLLGYALLPWAVAAIYKFTQKPQWRTAWPVAAWTAAIGLTSIHTIGFVFVIGVALVIASGKTQLKTKAKWGGAIIGIWLVVNAIWLVPLLLGQSQTSHNIAGFSNSQMEAFKTHGTVLHSVPLSAALLTGFWADGQNRYILPSSLPIWWVGVVVIVMLVVVGATRVIKQRDKLGMSLATTGVLAWFLGMGIAWSGSAWLTHLLVHIVPYYSGYREPQKWLMLLALAYSYMAAVGASYVYEWVRHGHYKRWADGVLAAALLAPFLFAPTLAWGAAGQLHSADYPKGWYAAKDYLDDHANKDTQVLVLPWHLYLPISFTDRVVANPSSYFFDQNMITGNNFELRGVPDQNPTALTQYVGNQLVPLTSQHSNVGHSLGKRHVQYVLLLKEADYKSYSWLDQQTDLPAVLRNSSVVLYKVAP